MDDSDAPESDAQGSQWKERWRRLTRATPRWIADTLRFPFSAVYWNARKWIYVRRGRTGECPCHDLSDTGVAGRTHCIAVQNWNSPGRFRVICPLLVKNELGWCCSVAPSGVRPFLRRFFVVCAISTVVAYAGGALLALGALHRIGYHGLRYTDVLWPGTWHRFKSVQAEFYRAQAATALTKQEYRKALVALSTAMATEPDYETGMTLAVMSSYSGGYGSSDSLFARLLQDYPSQAQRTAVAFHDQLLGTLRLRRLADLCLERFNVPGEAGGAWLRVLLFSADHGRFAAELMKSNPRQMGKLPPGALVLLTAYALRDANTPALAHQKLLSLQPSDGVPLYVVALETQLALGFEQSALTSLYTHARELPAFERAYLQYLATALRGDPILAQSDFLALLRLSAGPGNLDRICTALIRAKDGASLDRLWSKMRSFQLSRDNSVALAAIWATARVCGREDIAKEVSERGAVLGLGHFPSNGRIDFLSNRPNDPAGLRVIFATTELPRETIMALVREAVAQRWAVADKEKLRAR